MIIDLQRRLAEIGRIRIGQQVPVGNGSKKTRPAKLTTFRLTSPDRNRIAQAALLYGGNPAEWDAPAGKQWEVITESDALNVIVPPSDMAFSQHYELWSGGGCQRRCDGRNESISDGPCICDPDKRECAIHTRLSVMLRDLPGLGVWRIDTSGYYAALELQGAVEIVQLAAGRGQMLPARLRLEQRMVKRPGQSTKRFAVPVLDIEVSPAQLMAGGAATMIDGTPETIAIEPPAPTVAELVEQVNAQRERKRRKNSAQPVARTGLKPRTAAEANASRSNGGGGQGETGIVVTTSAPPADDSEAPASTAQNRKMHALFRDLGLTEREDRLIVTSSILGFDVSTSSQLTVAEASKLIDTLDQWWTGECYDDAGNKISTDDKIREILNAATLAEVENDTAATQEGN
ncbi:endodeoxyribonuclease RusA-like protein [Thermacetogenium phaeum DSM] [Mycobacterium shimoidei]|uniref:Endodeoxyribonuclease RusA-like protein [Thermacetogenium phaeum DSM] n=1 Tax=Mycobacterium shimoidei TaxID=29313 RepID=A0A375YXJ3_MYCSH|nr:hypothetical protein [Mycobacterium shimoidei]SRX93589.1 endodeoxyribonuclease RusA-like protein [Thermacetogenium phaeum DSM] [Mycobacterium shimoidei]